MKVLITGSAGFIGSNLSQKLLNKDHRVFGVDNFNDYYNPQFKKENINSLKSKRGFKQFKVDIRDKEKIEKIFNKVKPQAVVHLAARAGVRPSLEKPNLYSKVNIGGSLNIFEASKDQKVNKVVFASSSSVYGGREKVPFKETDKVNKPISPYAATKKAGELLAYNYHHHYDLPLTCLRFFTVYGPKGRPDMAPYLFTDWIAQGKQVKMFGDGSSRRDYTYIDDITEGINSSLNKDLGYEIINLGNSQTVELKYFIKLIGKILNKKPKIKRMPEQPGDVPITYADISKAKELLNYSPQTSIEEGMNKFINWFKKNRL